MEKALNHVIGGVRGIYNRAEYAPQRREMLQFWADYVEDPMEDGARPCRTDSKKRLHADEYRHHESVKTFLALELRSKGGGALTNTICQGIQADRVRFHRDTSQWPCAVVESTGSGKVTDFTIRSSWYR